MEDGYHTIKPFLLLIKDFFLVTVGILSDQYREHVNFDGQIETRTNTQNKSSPERKAGLNIAAKRQL